MIRYCSLLILSSIFYSQSLLAWGQIGHKIVGQLAENQLSLKAKEDYKKILPNQSLADVSTWADVIRGDSSWDKSKPWHFTDIPDGEEYKPDQHPDGDVVSAINSMIKTLQDQNSSMIEKQNSLKFIIHFVGDIHQPLHTGRPEDRGGNSISVSFMGKNTNLHALWDSSLIEYQKLGYLDYVKELESKFSQNKSSSENIFDYNKVIKFNMEKRSQLYNFKLIGSRIILDKQYFQNNKMLLDSCLYEGGRRLAFILNSIFI